MAAGHDASAQQEAYAMHLNQEQAAAAAGYEQVAYDHQSGLTHEQMAAAAAHAAYGTGPPAGCSHFPAMGSDGNTYPLLTRRMPKHITRT